MKLPDNAILDRFHRTLVEEIRQSVPGYLTGTFTVAEIYQTLVPYRTHRDRIGVDMNGDYEDALLRLLAGEGDFLILESDPAVDQIRRELRTTNPNTGLYREFAALGVRLNTDRLPDDMDVDADAPLPFMSLEDNPEPSAGSDGDDPEPWAGSQGGEPQSLAGAAAEDPEPEPSVGAHELAPEPEPGTPSGARALEPEPSTGVHELEPEPSAGADADEPESLAGIDANEPVPEVVKGGDDPDPASADANPTSADMAASAEECPACERSLPPHAALRFCPFCGSNVRSRPCGACGEELEWGWKYCVACGVATHH